MSNTPEDKPALLTEVPLEDKPTLLIEVPPEEKGEALLTEVPTEAPKGELLTEETVKVKKPRKPRSPNKPKAPKEKEPEVAAAEVVAYAAEAISLAAEPGRVFTPAQRKKLLSNYSKRTLKARFGITL